MEKIKWLITNCIESDKGKDIFIVIIIILVGLSSFELGRLSKENGSSGVKIEYPNASLPQSTDQQANVIQATEALKTLPVGGAGNNLDRVKAKGKNFFASTKGHKYYPLGCSAGKSIKQENRVYFDTAEAAESAGYELSSSCN